MFITSKPNVFETHSLSSFSGTDRDGLKSIKSLASSLMIVFPMLDGVTSSISHNSSMVGFPSILLDINSESDSLLSSACICQSSLGFPILLAVTSPYFSKHVSLKLLYWSHPHDLLVPLISVAFCITCSLPQVHLHSTLPCPISLSTSHLLKCCPVKS